MSDFEEIARLCAELGYQVAPGEMKSRVARMLDEDDHWIAVAPGPGDRLLGWVSAERRISLESGERIELVGLVVDRSARGKGIGKALVSAAEEWALSKGVSNIFVRSNIVRSESHPFYEGIGYQLSKTQHVYTKGL